MSDDLLKKKRKKIKALRRELHTIENKVRQECAEERRELQEYIAKCETTIQDLLTLRMFLRSSIEWIKTSVADSFPRYNSFVYTLMFSNFGLFLSKAFIDFIGETGDSSVENSTRAFWVPYIVWVIFGAIGWFIDKIVSRKNSLGRRLDIIREATFGGIDKMSMYKVLDPSSGMSISSIFEMKPGFELKQKLGGIV